MFEAILARLGFQALGASAKWIGLAVLISALNAAAGLGFWRGMARIDTMEARARSTAISEVNAAWSAKIEKQNREIAERHAAEIKAQAEASARVAAENDALKSTIDELEKRNAALPNGDRIGLDAARSGLLIP